MERYKEYKDSGVEWLGEIPVGWEVVRFRFIGDNIIGLTYKPDDVVTDSNEGILVLRSSNIQDGRLAFQDCVYVDKEIPERLYIKEGDVLICARNGSVKLVGKSAYIDDSYGPMTFGAFMAIARSSLDKYMYYYFNSSAFKSQQGLFATSTINQLTSGIINDLTIPVPTQREDCVIIATYLDRKTAELDALIADKRRLLELYAAEKTAVINRAVTRGLDAGVALKDSGVDWLGAVPAHWEVKKLKHVCDKIGSGVTPRGGARVYQTEGVKFLRSQNIHFDGFKLEDVAYISEETHQNMINSSVQVGDVLLNITGASIGRVYYTDDHLGEANVNQHVCILRPGQGIVTEYLYLVLRSYIGQTQIDLEQTGSGREGLNFESLRNFDLPLPAVDDQLRIAQNTKMALDEVDKYINTTTRLIDLLTEYRTTLISEAVTGKIKVT